MKFYEEVIEVMGETIENFFVLISEYLCCNPKEGIIPQDTKDLLKKNIIQEKRKINLEQFNEILLLLRQNRISEGFFEYFFKNEITNFTRFKNGIIKFRGYSLLVFGNFRFSYKKLS